MAKITIFGLAGTGTSTVGRALAEELDHKFLSTGDIFFRKKAKELGLTLSELHARAASDPAIDRECDDEVKKFGEENDNFVVESRLAWFFIPDSIKIKLVCEFDERVGRVAQRDGVSFKEACDHVISREKADNLRYKIFYGIKDINDDKHFDIIIDTTIIPIEEVVKRARDFFGKFGGRGDNSR